MTKRDKGPRPKLQLRLPEEQRAIVEDIARMNGCHVSQTLAVLVERSLQREGYIAVEQGKPARKAG